MREFSWISAMIKLLKFIRIVTAQTFGLKTQFISLAPTNCRSQFSIMNVWRQLANIVDLQQNWWEPNETFWARSSRHRAMSLRTPSINCSYMWINTLTETERPATPSFCWSWSRQSLAFIFSRNDWLNMTGRKWESEVDDASRYCQITRRMHQICLFLHPVLVISLASFSLVNFSGMKVSVGESHQPCIYNKNHLKTEILS